MKVVINKCFGGFGLSTAAMKRYAELKGLKYVVSEPSYTGHKGYDLLTSNFDLPDIITKEQWNKGRNKIISDNSIDRADPILVQVVEELGSKKASADYAKLGVVEIPNGISYEIQEYDGNEHIAEPHQTWS